MLAHFAVRRDFNKLAVVLYVDCQREEASATVTYSRRIIRLNVPVPFQDAATPEAAEGWLCRPVGECGSLLERLEYDCRTGLLTPELVED